MWEIELTEEQIKNLREAGKSGKIKVATEKESCIHVLRGLISYHERMTMGDFPQKDLLPSTTTQSGRKPERISWAKGTTS